MRAETPRASEEYASAGWAEKPTAGTPRRAEQKAVVCLLLH